MTSATVLEESGQTVVEMAIILLALFMLTIGLVDVGRAFFQYNDVAASARYAARWASVEGGVCALPYAVSASDFCNQIGNGTGGFWTQTGNKPLQGNGVACPSYSVTPADYYTASNFIGSTQTTIVGALVQKIDSNDGSTNFMEGPLTPSFDLTQLRVCIAVSTTSSKPSAGDTVSVTVYDVFKPAGALYSAATVPMSATSQFQVE